MTGFDVSLDGVALNDVAPSVLVVDIRTQPDRETAVAARSGHGSRLSHQTRKSLSVTVTFEVHESDPAQRQTVLDRIGSWCGGTLLTMPSHPGRQLHVVCTALPTVSARRWTDELTAVFTAYDQPFWEEEEPACTRASGARCALCLALPGNTDTVLEAEATNRSGSCNALAITANGCTLTFEDLALAGGETLAICHDPQGRLTLLVKGADGERSAYGRRSALSCDEIILHPGENQVTCTADCTLDWRCMGRGRWL